MTVRDPIRTASGYQMEENLRRELTRRKLSLIQRRDQSASRLGDVAANAAVASFNDTLAVFEQWGPPEVRAVIQRVRETNV